MKHITRLRIDERLEVLRKQLRTNVDCNSAAIANMHDRSTELLAADEREQAIRDAMAKKGTQS